MNKDDINSIIQEIGNKVGDFAKTATEKTTEFAQAAAKKSKDTLDITKLNLKISEEKGYIRQKHENLGAMLYEKYKSDLNNAPEDIKDILSEITVGFETIQLYETKINEIKNKSQQDGEYTEEYDYSYEDSEITPDDIEEDICDIVSVDPKNEDEDNKDIETVINEIEEKFEKLD